ncbi:MAG TPA: 4-alpha-glucanotransferase [Lentisphaeria bacterium]|nr:MAG: hypothetical protein A2X47_09295 [Lentisphaerae bacterium GWF2_38_69]HBM15940.1 4-alpha-glucanotransferase [Lentisphaeria bacterium]
MNLKFSITYNSTLGRCLFICGAGERFGEWNTLKAHKMKYKGESKWIAEMEFADSSARIEYKYVECNDDGTAPNWELGKNRVIEIAPPVEFAEIADTWQAKDNNAMVISSSAFKKVVFKRDVDAKKFAIPALKSKKSKMVIFEVATPKIMPGHTIVLVGSCPELGSWDTDKSVAMTEVNPYVWRVAVEIDSAWKVEYKYAVLEPRKMTVMETGDNRSINLREMKYSFILKKDQNFNYGSLEYRGAGLAIPVFSIRTQKSCGVGDFADIKLLVDWCKKVGINMLQLLPVNDTVSTHTWVDSYPYGGISVFALHPMYINIDALGNLPFGAASKEFQERRKILNSLPSVDYEAVMKEKSIIYKKAYDYQKEKFLADSGYQKFFKENEDWLVPYAAFSYLRDLYKTPDYTKWGTYAVYDKRKIEELVSPKANQYDDIAVHYYIQYQLHKQLLDASCYARENGVFLKGDLPIGIIRNSIDAWVAPHLYNMGSQAGAPPDDYAADGQNWGFPTYNWDEMAKDNYKWWRNRLTHMAKYFDAYRIDHLLGFFRIWQMPYEAISGLLGNFYPALPISKEEIIAAGLPFDDKILCNPLITKEIISNRFKGSEDAIIKTYLKEISPDRYALKDEFKTQRLIDENIKITSGISEKEKAELLVTKKALSNLLVDVLFIKDKSGAYHPRIEINKTESFKALKDETGKKVYDLYLDYFYKRQEGLWREQAMVKLPALAKSTDMLVCGEDLGMVPNCVPGVMDELGLLSLKIQRMPKEGTFGVTQNYPYLSVCTPSCHDMSTVRGWWEEDRGKTQRFYNEILHCEGNPPYYCEPWVVERIISDHLNSSCMWAVFPIQDLIGIDEKLRLENPNDERINVPSIPHHYWRYRLHLTLEDLMNEKEFNSKLRLLITTSGRNTIRY